MAKYEAPPTGGFREDSNVKICCCCHKKSSIIGGATITYCAQTAHITNICIKTGLTIFNTLAVTLRTDDAGHCKQDADTVPHYSIS